MPFSISFFQCTIQCYPNKQAVSETKGNGVQNIELGDSVSTDSAGNEFPGSPTCKRKQVAFLNCITVLPIFRNDFIEIAFPLG